MEKRLLPLCIFSALGFTAFAADTSQDFTATFSPPPASVNTRFDQSGTTPPASWFDGTVDGWDGGYVQLTDAVNSQNNAISINDSTGTGWNTLTVDFDFRGIAGSGGGADGFGVLLFPATAPYENTVTAPPNWGEAEEPNFAGSFGLGLDTYGNTGVGQADEFVGDGGGSASNHTSLHWNNASITQNTTTGSVIPEFLIGGGATDYIRGQLILDVSTPGSETASLTLDAAGDGIGTNVLSQYTNVPIAGLTASDFRIALRGRTGGANEQIQFDNIKATTDTAGVVIDEDFASAPSTPNAVYATPTGGTPYTIQTISGNTARILTEATSSEFGSGVEAGVMLITEEFGGQNNVISFDQTSTDTKLITGSFEFAGVNGDAGRADGIGFLLADADTHGTTGGIGDFGVEEPSFSNSLGIGIDTHPGGGDDNSNDNHLSLHWNGAFLDRVETSDFDIVNGVGNRLDFTLTEVAGGYELDVTVTDASDASVTTIWDDYFIAGMAFGPGGARAAFGARTGGLQDNYLIDNVNIQYIPEPGSAALLGLGAMGLLLRRRRR